jgi:glycosyltransferase involved in cell wall biosynthesis
MSANGVRTEPRIAVIIPVFNRERTIGRAIESVLTQASPPAEVLVVDDGSSDGTADVIAGYGGRVRYLHQSNEGASAARNHGVARAAAPWVAFLDSDDRWLDDHLGRMAEAIVATGGTAGFYFADTRRPAAEGVPSLWEVSGFASPGGLRLTHDATDWVLMDIQPMMLQSSVFNRDRYMAAGGLWPALRIREDTHLYFVLGIGGSACAVAHAGVQMTADDDSGQRLTDELGPATNEWWLQTRLLYTDVLRRFPDLPRHHRRRLKARLAAADLRLGQNAWNTHGRVGPAVRHVLQGVGVAPGHLAGRAVRRLGRTVRADVVAPPTRNGVGAGEVAG